MKLNNIDQLYIKQILKKIDEFHGLHITKDSEKNIFYYSYNYSSLNVTDKTQQDLKAEMLECLKNDFDANTPTYSYVNRSHYDFINTFDYYGVNIELIKKAIFLVDNRSFYLNNIGRGFLKDVKKRDPESINNMISFLALPTYFLSDGRFIGKHTIEQEQFEYYMSLVSRVLKKLPEKKEQIIDSLTYAVKHSPGVQAEWVINECVKLFKNEVNLDDILEKTGFFQKKAIFHTNEVHYLSFFIDDKTFKFQYKGKDILQIVKLNQFIIDKNLDFPKFYLMDMKVNEFHTMGVENKGFKPIEKVQKLIDLCFSKIDDTISLEDLVFKAKMDVEMLENNDVNLVKKTKNKI